MKNPQHVNLDELVICMTVRQRGQARVPEEEVEEEGGGEREGGGGRGGLFVDCESDNTGRPKKASKYGPWH